MRLDITGKVATLVIDRPPANALNRIAQRDLRDFVLEAGENHDVRAIVVCGEGGRFSAGADIHEMKELSTKALREHAFVMQAAFTAVANAPVPVCAAIEGYALGGGLELACACDFRICADDARLGLPEINLGVIPGGGGTQHLTRLIGPARAKYSVMTGDEIPVKEAEALRLVDAVVPAGTALSAAHAFVARFLDKPRDALGAAKRAINAGFTGDGLRAETRAFIDLIGTPAQREGMTAFIEKRLPNFN